MKLLKLRIELRLRLPSFEQWVKVAPRSEADKEIYRRYLDLLEECAAGRKHPRTVTISPSGKVVSVR